MQGKSVDVALLRNFRFDRVLNDDPLVHSLFILGKLPHASSDSPSPAIISLQRTHLPVDFAHTLVQDLVEQVKPLESNDIYHWLLGWLARNSECPDVKINVICPATDVHIRKYSRQRIIMVKETPLLYQTVVQPYIQGFPPSRFEWVHNILSHNVESNKLLFEDNNPETGFIILPDMKWDLETISSLYLVAIVHSRSIATLRDLTRKDIPMLKAIRREAGRLVREKWGLEGEQSLRFYIHYQPSYFNANYSGFKGICIGQAHLLEDIISLLELSPLIGPTLLAQMTLTYELGEQSALFQPMLEAQDLLDR
ncbi:scavenger mRNA decapping enzyme [Gautieria morchelliformis]|nr:scavenger mRNA decapping enzyme [Gautieria morchelliformis]